MTTTKKEVFFKKKDKVNLPIQKKFQEKITGIFKVLNALDQGSVVLSKLAQEMDLNVRTLQRYINVLESANIPLYNPKVGEWSFMEGHSLKKMQFSKDEVWLLVLIEDWVSCLSNKKLSQAFKDFKTRVLGSEFESPFYIKENEGSAYELSNETKILETAINNCQMIGIKYFSDNEGKNKIIQNLKPLKIACFDGFWYLIALGFGDKLLKFRILNIKSVQPKNKKFVYEGNIKDILRESKNIWFESERNIEVKILVKKEVAKYFKNKKYFPMQTIDPDNKNGDFVLTCKTSKLQEIQQTILHWIPYIKIISPKNYAEGIKAKVKDYLKDID